SMTPQELAKKQAEYQDLLARMRQVKNADERRKLRDEILKLQPFIQPRGAGGRLVGADGWGDLYFLWSMERMAVVYDLKTIAGKDWHTWGSEILMNAQGP